MILKTEKVKEGNEIQRFTFFFFFLAELEKNSLSGILYLFILFLPPTGKSPPPVILSCLFSAKPGKRFCFSHNFCCIQVVKGSINAVNASLLCGAGESNMAALQQFIPGKIKKKGRILN